MELNKFERQLKLLELLIDNEYLTISEMGQRLGISVRSVYRYIQFFESNGFDVYNDQGIYSVGHNSPFVAAVSRKTHFTSDELQCVGSLISQADPTDPNIIKLKYKFRNVYGMDFGQEEFKFDRRISENVEALKKAIENRRQCVLQKYNSLNSKDLRDRLVEPFQFLGNTNEVRCYELDSGMCKTFKVPRVKGKVMVREQKWAFTDRHASYFTDIFGFSGERVWKVVLRLTALSKTILMEEYGMDETRFVMEDATHFLVHLPVCNMKGVGRFVMGLIDETEIVRGEELRAYVHEKLRQYVLKST